MTGVLVSGMLAVAAPPIPGGSLTCSAPYTSTPADFDTGSITNTASVEGTTARGESVPASDSVVVTTDQTPRVSLIKQSDTTTVSAAGQTVTYTIVGSTEADPAEKKLSNESPVGRALLGQKKGATVNVQLPNGKARELTIQKIEVGG